MRWTTRRFLAVALLGMIVTQAIAAPPSVTIDKVDNTKAGQITVTGSYADIPDGTSSVAVTVEARPAGGAKGQGGQGAATINKCGQTYSGTAKELPNGTYDVQAILTVQPTVGSRTYYYSATKANVKLPPS